MKKYNKITHAFYLLLGSYIIYMTSPLGLLNIFSPNILDIEYFLYRLLRYRRNNKKTNKFEIDVESDVWVTLWR